MRCAEIGTESLVVLTGADFGNSAAGGGIASICDFSYVVRQVASGAKWDGDPTLTTEGEEIVSRDGLVVFDAFFHLIFMSLLLLECQFVFGLVLGLACLLSVCVSNELVTETNEEIGFDSFLCAGEQVG